MVERELFQIGEVAKMYHLSVGTLRHYEQVGLLKPEYTDPATGYRYYSVRQFEQLTNIRYLRALGLPLDEIAATLQRPGCGQHRGGPAPPERADRPQKAGA